MRVSSRVLVPPPLPRQPFPFELLDPVGRDFVQDQRSECAIQDVDDLAIAVDAPLVLLGVVGQVRVGTSEM